MLLQCDATPIGTKNLNIRRISGIGNCRFERQSYWPKIADIPGILQTIVLVENIQIVGANDQSYQLLVLSESYFFQDKLFIYFISDTKLIKLIKKLSYLLHSSEAFCQECLILLKN